MPIEPPVIERVQITAQIGVIHAVLGPEKILPCRQHRDAERHEQQRSHQVRPAAVVGRRYEAVGVFVFGDHVDPRAVVVRLRVIHRLRRPLGKIPRRATQKILHAFRRPAAPHVVAHEIAVTIVPRRPTGVTQSPRDVPAKTPRLRDQNHVGLHALQRHLDIPQDIRADELREVEAKSVHPKRLDQVNAAVDNQAFRHRGTRPQIVPAPTEIGEVARGVLFKIIKPVDEHQMRRHADVIIDDIEQHRHAAPMKRRNQFLQLAHT